MNDLIYQLPEFNFQELVVLLRDNKTSRHLRSKFRNTQIGYLWLHLPQGYSNSFVSRIKALEQLYPNESNSLLNLDNLSNLQFTNQTFQQFIYVGEETNRGRQTVRYFKNQTDSIFMTKKSGFG